MGDLFPVGVAVDQKGNLFVADYDLLEIHARTGKQTILLPQFIYEYQFLNDPWGVAVDAAGDAFVANLDYTDVWEVPAGGLHGGFPVDAGQGGYATGVAVDAADDLFITDPIGGQVLEYQAGNGVPFFDGGEINFPNAVAVDGMGNLFLAQSTYNGNTLVQVKGSQPATVDFGKVAAGTTSAPQSVTIQNVGNQPLSAVPPGLSISSGFVQVPGSGSFPDCTAIFSLLPGAVCNLSISFVPQGVGFVKGTATFTDNALNTNPSASQSVKLISRGVQ